MTRQAFLSFDFWDIADKDAGGNYTGSSKQYTHLNILAYPKKDDENQFGHQVVKLNSDQIMFEKMRSLNFDLTTPIPCNPDVEIISGKNRKATAKCTDIEFDGQSLLYDKMDVSKLPKSDSKFNAAEQVQGAISLALKVGYDLMDARIIPLRILGITKRGDDTANAQVYIASADLLPDPSQHFGFLLTKGDANPTLVTKLKRLVPQEEIKLKFFECVGVCFPRRGSKELDNFYLADIFFGGSFLIRATPPASASTQKKS